MIAFPEIHRFEVLSQERHKYTSTEVFGGGGTVSGYRGMTFGTIQEVQSRTLFHDDVELWLRNLTTGKEINLKLSNVDFDARKGHKVVGVFDPLSGLWERFVNEDTGAQTTANGAFHHRLLTTAERLKFGFYVFLLCLILLVPVGNIVGVYYAFPMAWRYTVSNCVGLEITQNTLRRTLALLAGVSLIIVSYSIFFNDKESAVYIIGFGTILAIVMAYNILSGIFDINKASTARTELINSKLSSFLVEIGAGRRAD